MNKKILKTFIMHLQLGFLLSSITIMDSTYHSEELGLVIKSCSGLSVHQRILKKIIPQKYSIFSTYKIIIINVS